MTVLNYDQNFDVFNEVHLGLQIVLILTDLTKCWCCT